MRALRRVPRPVRAVATATVGRPGRSRPARSYASLPISKKHKTQYVVYSPEALREAVRAAFLTVVRRVEKREQELLQASSL